MPRRPSSRLSTGSLKNTSPVVYTRPRSGRRATRPVASRPRCGTQVPDSPPRMAASRLASFTWSWRWNTAITFRAGPVPASTPADIAPRNPSPSRSLHPQLRRVGGAGRGAPPTAGGGSPHVVRAVDLSRVGGCRRAVPASRSRRWAWKPGARRSTPALWVTTASRHPDSDRCRTFARAASRTRSASASATAAPEVLPLSA